MVGYLSYLKEEETVEQDEQIEVEVSMLTEEYAALLRLAKAEKRGPNEHIALLVRRELLALGMLQETCDEILVRDLRERRIINEWESSKIGPVPTTFRTVSNAR